jgi:quinol monooxygenase YgiN
MHAQLRLAVITALAWCAGTFGVMSVQADSAPKGAKKMYGLIGKMTAVEGKRDQLIDILLEGTREMPGCLSYVVARDPGDSNSIWVTEVWEDQSSHQASLAIPAVRTAIAKGKPLIAKFGSRVITEPVGGHGLSRRKDS